MTIQRAQPTRLKKQGRQYTVLPNDSIELIRNADSLAIWVYLQTKPQDWIIRSADLMARFASGDEEGGFKMGRVRYRAAMNHLRDVGLIDYVYAQGKGGRLEGRILICLDTPRGTNPYASVEPRGTDPRASVNASLAEPAHLQKTESFTKDGFNTKGDQQEKKISFHPSHSKTPYEHPIPLPAKTPADELREYLDRKMQAAGE